MAKKKTKKKKASDKDKRVKILGEALSLSPVDFRWLLDELISTSKSRRRANNMMAAADLYPGAKVKWTGPEKRGFKVGMKGMVTKVGRTRVHVDFGGTKGIWKVGANFLEKDE